MTSLYNRNTTFKTTLIKINLKKRKKEKSNLKDVSQEHKHWEADVSRPQRPPRTHSDPTANSQSVPAQTAFTSRQFLTPARWSKG